MQCHALDKTVCGRRPQAGRRRTNVLLQQRADALSRQRLSAARPVAAPVGLTFEAGQLRLIGEKQRLAALRLPGARWEAARAAYLAPACRYRELLRALWARGVACEDRVRGTAEGPLLLLEPALSVPAAAAFAAWNLAGRRGTVVLPCPGDRYAVALAAAALLRRPTLILVARRSRIAPWVSAIRQLYAGPLGVGEGELRPLMLTTFAVAGRQLARWGNRFSLLVVDDADRWARGRETAALELGIAGARLGVAPAFAQSPLAQETLDARLGPLVSCCSSNSASSGLGCSRVQLFLPLSAAERRAYQRAQAGRAGQTSAAALRLVGGAAAKLERVGRLLSQHDGQRLLIVAPDDGVARALSRRYLIPALTTAAACEQRPSLLRRLGDRRQSFVVSAELLAQVDGLPPAEGAILLGQLPAAALQRLASQLQGLPPSPPLLYELLAQETFEAQAQALPRPPAQLRVAELRCLHLWA